MVSKSTLMSRDAQTDRAFREIVTKEKSEQQAKSARLKALRLARDADEAATAAAAPQNATPAAKPRKAAAASTLQDKTKPAKAAPKRRSAS